MSCKDETERKEYVALGLEWRLKHTYFIEQYALVLLEHSLSIYCARCCLSKGSSARATSGSYEVDAGKSVTVRSESNNKPGRKDKHSPCTVCSLDLRFYVCQVFTSLTLTMPSL